MAYRFQSQDPTVADAVRRIACQQIDGAIHAIDQTDAATAIHEVRKCCKKVRALLRLIRPAFPHYAKENAYFRDLARSLAGTRDAKVLLDTCDLIAADVPQGVHAEGVASLRQQLAEDKARQAHANQAATHLRQARKLLEKARKHSEGWALDREGWGALAGGLGRIVREARKMERTIRVEASETNYHELRKLMKYHWYHTRLLVPVWPGMMTPRAAELGRLAELLGLHHDICVFEEWLGAALASGGRFDAVEVLLPVTGDRRERLEREIRPVVARTLAQTPSALGDHWEALWKVWRGETGEEDH